MQANCIQFPAKLEVFDPEGHHLFWCEEHEAREMIRLGQAHFFRRNGKVRALHATTAGMIHFGEMLGGRGSGLDCTRFSHTGETDQTPARVWSFIRLPKKPRLDVIEGCIKLAA